MRLLLFLILGTLFFGIAFPAFILIVGFLLLIFAALAIFSFLTGAFGGRNVIIYRNGGRTAPRDERNERGEPEMRARTDCRENSDIYNFGEDAEGEVVELPSSALTKDSEEQTAFAEKDK